MRMFAIAGLALLLSACGSSGFALEQVADDKGAEVTTSAGTSFVGYTVTGDLRSVTASESAVLGAAGVEWVREAQCTESECLREGFAGDDTVVLATNTPVDSPEVIVTITVVSQ